MHSFWDRVRISPTLYRRFALVILVLSMLIIVTGGSVRLTGSGMGCPDWPVCEQGQLVKVDTSTVKDTQGTIESVNRAFTAVIAFLSAVLALGGSWLRRPYRKQLSLISLGFIGGIVAQSVLGGLTVIFHLKPQVVAAHFMLSIFILWVAVLLYHRAGDPDEPPTEPVVGVPAPRAAVRSSRLIAAWAIVVFTLGTVVTGSGPHAGDENAERLGFALGAATRVHSVAALLLLGAAVWFAWWLRSQPVLPAARSRAWWVVGILVAQATVGYVQYFLRLPAPLVAVHLTLAGLMWIAVVQCCLYLPSRERVAAADDTVAAAEPVATGATR
jgi:cytochrome c oxidase assembly protein subunit 15